MTLSGSVPVYLSSYLEPLNGILARADVTDIYINSPGEAWAETLGGSVERHAAPGLTPATLERLARQIAAFSHQGVSREHPILSASLPDGSRVQVVMPPATRGNLAIAIRKHVSADMSVSDLEDGGMFADARSAQVGGFDEGLAALRRRLDATDIAGLLVDAVRSRRNILVSGGTSTGKTTFLNALVKEIPPEERLIVIEDAPELQVARANSVCLLAPRGSLGEAQVSAEDLLNASLRMRPDRILLGELRGPEAFTFLRAVNTGHPGSMTTIHADSPDRAVEQLALLVLQTGTRLSRDDVVHYVRTTIDVFVQLGRHNGKRRVTAVALREH